MTDSPKNWVVLVSDVIDLKQSVVASGEELARICLRAFESHDIVSVVLDGLPGAPSSFFNVVLHGVIESLGHDEVAKRLAFVTSSRSVRLSLERSIEAFDLPASMIHSSAA